jgi:hypothetical protein
MRFLRIEVHQDEVVPHQGSNIFFRRTPDSAMWGLWSLATAGAGVAWAGVAYFFGYEVMFRLSVPLFLSLWPTFLGLLLGFLQGLVLRRYLKLKRWWMWIAWTSLAWYCAMLCLGFPAAIVMAGTGLNPEADVEGCLVVICGIAGAVFGGIQSPILASLGIPGTGTLWAIINGFAWVLGGLVGGGAGFAVYAAIGKGSDLHFTSVEASPSIAVGIFVAMLVIGVFTGLGLVWILKELSTGLSAKARSEP